MILCLAAIRRCQLTILHSRSRTNHVASLYGGRISYIKPVIIIIIIYFEKRPFFHAKLGLDVCRESSPSTYPQK